MPHGIGRRALRCKYVVWQRPAPRSLQRRTPYALACSRYGAARAAGDARARVRVCVQLESDRTAQLRKLADEFSHLEKSKERSATRMRQARAAGKRLPHARVVCRTRT